MGSNRRLLNVISIVQIIMSAIFLALGMADRYEARYIYTSYLFYTMLDCCSGEYIEMQTPRLILS